ncbi:cytochrome P450 [Cyathus striatus]|nr:cytochrome P450 [Cyathus striatus]
MAWSLYFLVLAFAGFYLICGSQRRRTRLPYPPGPPAQRILGHLGIMPSSNQEVVFREWSRLYGDIIYLHIPGRSYLVLNSLKVASEILDKRSGIYSDRMKFILYEMMGWLPNIAFLPYGKKYQIHRRLLQNYLHRKRCVSYQPLQIEQTRHLLVHLLENPNNWMDHFQRFSSALMVKIAYGKDIFSGDDPYIDISAKALKSLTSCGAVGSTPIDFMPFLRYLPAWFPGTYYAFKARSFLSAVRKMHDYPFDTVKHQLVCLVDKAPSQLQGNYEDNEHLNDLKGSSCAIFAAGVETTYSTLAHFILAMVLFPSFQKKAQQEVDQVVGRNRLPGLSDRSSLPYVEAIFQEVLRWNPAAPSGIPHRSVAEDVYNGMFIPKGTIVIANAYAILRDESIYSDPDSFNPGRYMPKPEGNAEPYPVGHFGFGRRACLGRHLADVSLWIVISSILATLDIGPELDDEGKEIMPVVELVVGLASHPKHFVCSIKPRDQISESIIRQAQGES